MKHRIIFLLLLGICYSGIGNSMYAKKHFALKRGVNIAHWLSQSSERGSRRDEFFTEKDVKYIASMGFDHIRIPIDEEQMFDEAGNKEPEAFALLHRAIAQSLRANLRVIVDLHILRSHHFNAQEKPLFTKSSAQEAFYECWRKLSAELRKYPTSMVAYELMNEPVADDPEDWNRIANACFQVVRDLEPKRVVVIGSNRWQSFDTVKDLKVPQGDKNIIISFHYYLPFLLTHYKASWTSQKDYAGPVHYPGITVNEEEFKASCPENLRASLQWNTRSKYDANRLKRDFQEAVDVANQYGLQVYCGEYGCMKNAPEPDRLRWHRDIEQVFDEMGIARALWCYRENAVGFGILKINTPDKHMIEAMGLKSKD